MQHDKIEEASFPAPDAPAEKKQQVRKLKFFHGSGVKHGADVALCVLATSASQCLALCEAADLRGINKSKIQSHWSTMRTPNDRMAQVMPVTDASVWEIDPQSSEPPVRLFPLQSAPVFPRLTRDNLPANWPFPTTVFSKETS